MRIQSSDLFSKKELILIKGLVPRVLISAPQSGVGKTTITMSVVAALKKLGLTVQTFKVGPDYLDPTYLSILSERPCYNLDGWMMGKDYIISLFLEKSKDVDISVIEGAMGLFDGARPGRIDSSAAEIGVWLKAPTVLVVNTHGMAGSIAALVKGFSTFEPALIIAGVIANYTGSENHAKWLEESCRLHGLAPLIGSFPRGAFESLPSRRLGLVTASCQKLDDNAKAALVDASEKYLDVEKLINVANSGQDFVAPKVSRLRQEHDLTMRIGIAFDEAFHFYYRDNLEALEDRGFELVMFSPIFDKALPADLDFLYFGGGYPEEYARELAANHEMLRMIKDFAESERPIYGECGGLMYLSQGIELDDGLRHKMVGLFPAWTKMRKSLRALRYCEVAFQEDTIIACKGDVLRGHEFHYSELVEFDDGNEWKRVYEVSRPSQESIFNEGFQRNNILLSYIHLHFASHQKALDRMVSVSASRPDEEAD